jgi:hypothetical protein
VSAEPNLRGASSLPPDQADLRRQQEIGKSIGGAAPDWVKSGRMVPGSLTDANEGSVTHGLKRTAKGWILVSPSGTADRVAVVQTGVDGSVVKLKNVGATGTLTFSLWVF